MISNYSFFSLQFIETNPISLSEKFLEGLSTPLKSFKYPVFRYKNKMKQTLKIYIGNIPALASVPLIEAIIRGFGIQDFSIKKSKNKGQAKACHAVITLVYPEDFYYLLRLKSLPVVMKRGEILKFHPQEVNQSLAELKRLNRVISLQNPIFNGHPMYELEYVQYLDVSKFKGKTERTAQVIDRLNRRIYIDGFIPQDLDPNKNIEVQLSDIKVSLCKFLQQYGEIQAMFAKCKETKILIYATFVNKDSIEAWFAQAIPHYDPLLRDECGLINFNGKMLMIMRDSEIVDSSKHKHSSKSLKHRHNKLINDSSISDNYNFTNSGLKSFEKNQFFKKKPHQMKSQSLQNSPMMNKFRPRRVHTGTELVGHQQVQPISEFNQSRGNTYQNSNQPKKVYQPPTSNFTSSLLLFDLEARGESKEGLTSCEKVSESRKFKFNPSTNDTVSMAKVDSILTGYSAHGQRRASHKQVEVSSTLQQFRALNLLNLKSNTYSKNFSERNPQNESSSHQEQLARNLHFSPKPRTIDVQVNPLLLNQNIYYSDSLGEGIGSLKTQKYFYNSEIELRSNERGVLEQLIRPRVPFASSPPVGTHLKHYSHSTNLKQKAFHVRNNQTTSSKKGFKQHTWNPETGEVRTIIGFSTHHPSNLRINYGLTE